MSGIFNCLDLNTPSSSPCRFKIHKWLLVRLENYLSFIQASTGRYPGCGHLQDSIEDHLGTLMEFTEPDISFCVP